MTIDQLTEAGRLLYGDQWQSNLARDLNIDSRRVRQWLSGKTPVSPWVGGEIKALLEENAENIGIFLKENQDIA